MESMNLKFSGVRQKDQCIISYVKHTSVFSYKKIKGFLSNMI